MSWWGLTFEIFKIFTRWRKGQGMGALHARYEFESRHRGKNLKPDLDYDGSLTRCAALINDNK